MEAMPAIFFGHGNAMNALARNPWRKGRDAIGTKIPRPARYSASPPTGTYPLHW